MSADVAHENGILSSRPSAKGGSGSPDRATRPLGLGRGRDGLLHVPASLDPQRPAPLVIMLHGAGASAHDVMPLVSSCADKHSVLVLAPDARGATWDLIQGDYGPDVAFLDNALNEIFGTFVVDPERIAIAGFSDGASYALSLGLVNGALFSDILAFSPGFAAPSQTEDEPRIFISHGRQDPVLPIERCGERVAAALTRSGYDVDYREFSGGHVVPAEMVEAAFRRFLR
jgi:phospholipase/carboxylesterase